MSNILIKSSSIKVNLAKFLTQKGSAFSRNADKLSRKESFIGG